MSIANIIQEMDSLEYGEGRLRSGDALKAAKALRENYSRADISRISQIVKKAFEESGRTDCEAYHIYRGLSIHTEPDAEAVKLASIGYVCLGRADMKNKRANAFLRGVSWLSGAAPAAAKTIGIAGAVAGIPIGGGAWLIRRGLHHQDNELRQREMQRDTFGRLAQEVEEELQRRGLKATPANVAATVDYLT
jgi:hypothetical protein